MTYVADKLRRARSDLAEAVQVLTTFEHPTKPVLDCVNSALANLPDSDAVVDIAEVGKCSDKLQEVARERDELAAQVDRLNTKRHDTLEHNGELLRENTELRAALAKLEKP